ncbi:MAG TPA: MmgE/PrpD family protein [Candidatus Eremiobacteraceae bacterium]|nr:MmgE/PrpD family protein [Candidatus Eremiobacteraceae bacterium]
MERLTRELAHFCHVLGPESLDGQIIERGKYLLLDYLGVAIRGSLSESSQPVYRMLEHGNMAGPCSVIGTGLLTSPVCAALANGTASHSTELDDIHQGGSIHLGVVIFSTAIALSEVLPRISTDQFFCAVIAGYEVAARLAMAVQPKYHYEAGFHPTSTCGVFGAAVTAAKLLRLSEEQMLSAFGIAGSMSAGSLEFLADGAWTKRLHPGLAAQNGIQAAKLAAEGFRGPSTILEGRDGFLSSYSRRSKPELITKNLGKDFEILHTSVKPHACCRYMQSPIDAILFLATQHDIRFEQIARVEVAVLEAGWPLVCEPRTRKYAPTSIVDAQFSMPFGAAIALRFRDAGLEQFTNENFRAADIQSLMSKVVMIKDVRIEKNFPAEWPSNAKIVLEDGTIYEKFIRHPKGDPENPLSWEELASKFRSLAIPVLPEVQWREIENSLRGMDASKNIRDIWKRARLNVPERQTSGSVAV